VGRSVGIMMAVMKMAMTVMVLAAAIQTRSSSSCEVGIDIDIDVRWSGGAVVVVVYLVGEEVFWWLAKLRLRRKEEEDPFSEQYNCGSKRTDVFPTRLKALSSCRSVATEVTSCNSSIWRSDLAVKIEVECRKFAFSYEDFVI